MDLEILKIASDTKNNKIVKDHTHLAKLKNVICGDEMQISLKISNNKIVDFGYQCKSCIYCQASVSLLSKKSLNMKIEKINELCEDAQSYFDGNVEIIKKKWSFFSKLFQNKNLPRKECLLLPFKTLKKSLINIKI